MGKATFTFNLNRKRRRQYMREGAVPAKEPFSLTVGRALEVIREDPENWQLGLLECLSKIDPNRRIECVYDMPDGGAIMVVQP